MGGTEQMPHDEAVLTRFELLAEVVGHDHYVGHWKETEMGFRSTFYRGAAGDGRVEQCWHGGNSVAADECPYLAALTLAGAIGARDEPEAAHPAVPATVVGGIGATAEGCRCRPDTADTNRDHSGRAATLDGVDVGAIPTQAQCFAWAHRRGHPLSLEARALKLGEEAGEVQGAVIKIPEGRKTLADLKQEAAQLVLCILTLAEAGGFSLWEAVAAEAARASVGSSGRDDA